MFKVCGVPDKQFKTICSSIDKLDKTFWDDVRMEMIDEKGLDPVAADKLDVFIRIRGEDYPHFIYSSCFCKLKCHCFICLV